MIDITDEVSVEEKPAVPGKWNPSRILYHGIPIGHLECQGPVTDSPAYFFAFQHREGKYRYFKLEDDELPA